MKEIKITEKTTKKSLIDYLKSVEVKDKNLAERISYAVKMFTKDQTKVLKSDLFDLANEVMESLTPAPAPVEASLKPKKTGGITKAKKSEPVEEAPVEPEQTEEVEETEPETPAEKSEPKKSGKKSSLKPKDSQKVETVAPATNVGIDSLPSAKMFPAEIDHPELGKLISCTGAYTTYAEVVKALEEDKTLYFACYWTKVHLKKYCYAQAHEIDPKTIKDGFPHDLDILMAVLPCETMERLYAMSRYTEALFKFDGEDLNPIEGIDDNKNKFQVRVSAGMEFEIYRPADEEIVSK